MHCNRKQYRLVWNYVWIDLKSKGNHLMRQTFNMNVPCWRRTSFDLELRTTWRATEPKLFTLTATRAHKRFLLEIWKRNRFIVYFIVTLVLTCHQINVWHCYLMLKPFESKKKKINKRYERIIKRCLRCLNRNKIILGIPVDIF